MKAELPDNDANRLRALQDYHILDTAPERAYDELTELASYICGASISLVVFVDEDRQWFKSKVGLETTETSRDIAFCSHAILQDEPLIIEDTFTDERFANNPLVVGNPHIRFYAGVPLRNPEGLALGTLCVIDQTPKRFKSEQRKALKTLSRQVVTLLEFHKASMNLAKALEEVETLQGVVPICSYCKDIRSDTGFWKAVEHYVSEYTEAKFSHGICPACEEKHFPERHEA